MTTKEEPAHVKVLHSLATQGPGSHAELIERTGCGLAAVRAAVAHLRMRGPREVYVHKYVWGARRYVMVFAAGNKPDAIRPKGPPVSPSRPKRGFPPAHVEAVVLAGLVGGPKELIEIYTPEGPGLETLQQAASRLRKRGLIQKERRAGHSVFWSMSHPSSHTSRAPLDIPPHARRTVFVGGINPWTGAKVTI